MRKRSFNRRILIIVLVGFLLLLISVGYIFFYLKPSSSRNWESGFEKAPAISYSKNVVLISNIRDWEYDEKGPISFDYINEAYDPEKIKTVYFLLEPFSKWDGIAHTFLLFEFEDGKTVAVSIEARREKGEDYSAALGLLNQFELIYIWGTQRDLIGQRLNVEKSTVYKFPMTISHEYSKNIFLQLIAETENISKNPKFYNTLTDNCTNRIAYAANEIKPGVIPMDISWILPGYSDRLLDRLGFIDKGSSDRARRESYKIVELD